MIALEHPLKIDKAASALLIGVLTWTVYALNSADILSLGHSAEWSEMTKGITLGSINLHEMDNSVMSRMIMSQSTSFDHQQVVDALRKINRGLF